MEGNPEHWPMAELHEAAWNLVVGHFTERQERYLDHYRAAAGTGRTMSDPEKVLKVAREGRVDTLLVTPAAVDDDLDDVLESTLAETLLHNGRVVPVPEIAGQHDPLAALLRY